MDPVIGGLLLDVAGRVGAPIVKSLLQKYLGGTAAAIGGAVVDTIAGKVGVPPAELPNADPKDIEAAVVATEAEAPELLIQWNVQQKQANDLMLAEMARANEPTWTWAWRPGWMWFLMFLFAFRLVAVPIADAALGSSIAASVDLSVMMTLTTWFMALYMGGHTIKDAASKAATIFSGSHK